MFGLRAKTIYNRREKISDGVIIIDKDRIVDIGNRGDVILDKNMTLIDLGNSTIVPGFIDAHTHWVQTALETTFIDLSSLESVEAVIECVKNESLNKRDGSIQVFKNLRYDAFPDKRYPTLKEIDKVANNTIVVIKDQTSHGCVLNSNAIEFFQKNGMTLNGDSKASGLLTGDRSYKAMNIMFKHLSQSGDLEKAWMENCKNVMAKGVTAASALEGELGNINLADRDEIKSLMDLCKRSPIEMTLFYQTIDVDAISDLGLKQIGGCILADGAFAPHTAALYEPYLDDPTTKGILYISDEDMLKFVKEARAKKLQIAMHACGDAAIGQILKIYQEVLKEEMPVDHRCRIEHFEIPQEWQIKMASDLGVLASMQPAFDYYWGIKVYEKRLGLQRAKRKKPFRTAIDNNIHVPVGSDSPVTPIDPLLGMQALVTNTNVSERISVREAIELFTYESAYGVFKEKEYGSLEKGMLANLAVLAEDPEEVEATRIKDIKVQKTMVRGEFLFSDDKI